MTFTTRESAEKAIETLNDTDLKVEFRFGTTLDPADYRFGQILEFSALWVFCFSCKTSLGSTTIVPLQNL